MNKIIGFLGQLFSIATGVAGIAVAVFIMTYLTVSLLLWDLQILSWPLQGNLLYMFFSTLYHVVVIQYYMRDYNG